jgi:hypothetical protein
MSRKQIVFVIAGCLGLVSFAGLSAFSQNWTLVSGITAQDIAVGKNGSVWATGTNNAIYRWNGVSWQTMPGGAIRVAVDPNGDAWVVNAGDEIYKYLSASNSWERKPGSAKDIGIGAGGSVWIIGTGQVPGGYDIHKWNGNGWTKISGGALRIAVDSSGNAWVVNNSNNVFRYNGSTFVVQPGSVKDVGVGANGTVWCTGTDDRIYQWNGSNWTLKTGGARWISVAPDGNAWVVNAGGQVYRTTDAATSVQIKTLFPRGQTSEFRMLQALKIMPYTNTISLGGTVTSYAGLDPLGQAFGSLGLLAAEIYATQVPASTGEQLLSQISSDASVRSKVTGILGTLVMVKVSQKATDPQSIALQRWATDLFYSVKVRSAKAILKEYQRWKADPCTYTAEGYTKPPDCALKGLNFTQWYGSHDAPQDILAKAGLKSVLPNNADAYASGTAIALAAVTMGAASAAVMSGLGTIVASTSVNTLGWPIILSLTSLHTAFGGSGGMAGAAAGSIGSVSWAGVVAAPVAAAILAVVVGTIQGFKVVEQAKVEPMLKMKLGAAMSEPINLANVMAETNSSNLFFMAFIESAQRSFIIPPANVDGEVRFYCQAGYVSNFRLSYTLNGQTVTKTTQDLSVGYEETFPIPYNATNIRVQGWYALGGWKELFNQTLARPTYICYTSYGTIVEPRFKTDCPEVGNMTTQANQLTVTHGGGYIAWIRLTYNLNGQPVTKLDKSNAAAGWREVFNIPTGSTSIKLEVWSQTGWIGEPWKKFVDKSWPQPPNECVKIFGTTLDPKSNSECN